MFLPVLGKANYYRTPVLERKFLGLSSRGPQPPAAPEKLPHLHLCLKILARNSQTIGFFLSENRFVSFPDGVMSGVSELSLERGHPRVRAY